MSTLFIEGMQPLLLRSAPLFITMEEKIFFDSAASIILSDQSVYVKAFRMAYAQIV